MGGGPAAAATDEGERCGPCFYEGGREKPAAEGSII